MKFQSKQKVKKITMTIDSIPEKTFPLLCPERELEWLPGWKYQMIYSMSGFNEEGCVFSANLLPGIKMIWTTVIYDPENHKIIFHNFVEKLFTLRFEINRESKVENKTDIKIVQTYTSISKKGNYFIEKFTDKIFMERMIKLSNSLNYFLKTGSLLKNGGLK